MSRHLSYMGDLVRAFEECPDNADQRIEASADRLGKPSGRRYHRSPLFVRRLRRSALAQDRRTSRQRPVAATRPMKGDEYLESLRDGREIWIHGERVDDVTTHPAFRNGVRSVARLYDALHDPAHKDVLTVETDTGNGGFTHPFFRAPMSAEDLVRGRDAIAAWQRMTYGWMGRSPGLQGGVPRDLRPQRRLLRAVPGQRAPVVQGGAGEGPVHEPHARESAGRPEPGDPRGRGRLHPRSQGDGRRRGRARRQDGRDGIGVLELQLRLVPRLDPDQEARIRALVLRADERTGDQAALQAFVRVHGGDARAARSTTRCRAASTRTTRCSCSRTR